MLAFYINLWYILTMVLIIVFAVLMMLLIHAKTTKIANKRCWDKGPGESKIHKWVLRSTPNSKQIELVCKDCGQNAGED